MQKRCHRASAYNPALGTSPCNGVILAAGAPNGCAAQGFAGGVYSSNRSIIPSNYHLIAPRLGFAWDVFGKQKFVLRGGVGQFFARDPISGTTTRPVGSNPPFTIGSGYERTLDGPTFTSGVNLLDFSPGGVANQGVQLNTNLPNTWQWNLTTEVEPFHNAKLEMGYVGLRGIHLATYVDINQLPPQNRLAWITRPAGDNANKLFPFGAKYGGAPGAIYQWSHLGDSIYHSLQTMFTLKMAHNSIWQTSYTWSKNIANTETDYPNNQDGIADLYNPRASRGLATFDRPHVFSSSLVYYLPTLEGRNGFLKGVAGGWQTSRETLYVACSRAREGTRLFVDRESLGSEVDRDALAEMVRRSADSRAKLAAIEGKLPRQPTSRPRRAWTQPLPGGRPWHVREHVLGARTASAEAALGVG